MNVADVTARYLECCHGPGSNIVKLLNLNWGLLKFCKQTPAISINLRYDLFGTNLFKCKFDHLPKRWSLWFEQKMFCRIGPGESLLRSLIFSLQILIKAIWLYLHDSLSAQRNICPINFSSPPRKTFEWNTSFTFSLFLWLTNSHSFLRRN